MHSAQNVSVSALSIKNPDCHGFLRKHERGLKGWKRRYCVLKVSGPSSDDIINDIHESLLLAHTLHSPGGLYEMYAANTELYLCITLCVCVYVRVCVCACVCMCVCVCVYCACTKT